MGKENPFIRKVIKGIFGEVPPRSAKMTSKEIQQGQKKETVEDDEDEVTPEDIKRFLRGDLRDDDFDPDPEYIDEFGDDISPPGDYIKRENEAIQRSLREREAEIEQLSNVTLEEIENLVDKTIFLDIFQTIATRTGKPRRYSFTKQADAVLHWTVAPIKDRFLNLPYVARGQHGLMSMVVSYISSDNKRTVEYTLGVDFEGIKKNIKSFLTEEMSRRKIPFEISRQYVMSFLRHTVIHELTHLGSFGSMNKRVDINKDKNFASSTMSVRLGLSNEIRRSQIPIEDIDGTLKANLDKETAPEKEIVNNWWNEAVTEKLAREITVEYERRTGNFTIPDYYSKHNVEPQVIEAYPLQVESLNMLIGFLAKQLESTPDAIWQAFVKGYVSDPASFLNALTLIAEETESLGNWIKRCSKTSPGPDGEEEARVLLKELQEILDQAHVDVSKMQAVLNLA